MRHFGGEGEVQVTIFGLLTYILLNSYKPGRGLLKISVTQFVTQFIIKIFMSKITYSYTTTVKGSECLIKTNINRVRIGHVDNKGNF